MSFLNEHIDNGSHATPLLHRDCCVCGRQSHGDGLNVCFHLDDDGLIRANWYAEVRWQGYRGQIHGGAIAMLLDGAMTHCLLARQITAVTGRINIRYIAPMLVGSDVEIQARLIDRMPPLFITEASVRHQGEMIARADAKFMQVADDYFSRQ